MDSLHVQPMMIDDETRETARGLSFDPKMPSNAKNMGCDKETHRRDVLLAATPCGRIVEAVDMRCYSARTRSASVHYASVWINDGREYYASGYASANGGGYHKDSAAIAYAFSSAGVSGLPNFAGAGERSIQDAAVAVALALGLTPLFYVD